MEVLADVLQTLKLHGTVYFHARLQAPWGMEIPSGPFVGFHVVTQGECWIDTLNPRPLVRLSGGDVALFPHGDGHLLLHKPGASAIPAKDLLSRPANTDLLESPESTSLICGHFEYDSELSHPLFDTLESCIQARAGGDKECEWLATIAELAAVLPASHGANPATTAVVDRLAEALLLQTLASHAQHTNHNDGFLVAIRDRHIGKTLALMHRNFAHDWTLSELADAASMSRSVFTDRFRRLVGESPILYLARWRMLKARELLSNTNLAIGKISSAVGYRSEFAFSRAFKKLLGTTPGSIRKAAAERRQYN
jgi:AraC-like DNA-binding protein